MRIAVLNYSGNIGKTTIAAHMLSTRIPGARFFAVESINEAADTLGVDIEKLKGERFGELFRELLLSHAAIVDIGASNVEAFLGQMTRYAGSELEFDLFIVPVTGDTKVQKETVNTILALQAAGVGADRIQVVFNRVESDVVEEFPIVFGFHEVNQGFGLDARAAIPDNEVYDLLAERRMTLEAVASDKNDYRAMLRDPKAKDADKRAEWADLHTMKALAVGANSQLDLAFAAVMGRADA